jgi:hypothetical protein
MKKARIKRSWKHEINRMDIEIAEQRLIGRKAADRGNRDLAALYEKDAEELQSFRDALAAGDVELARRIADAMETAVRETIPVHVYYNVFPER